MIDNVFSAQLISSASRAVVGAAPQLANINTVAQGAIAAGWKLDEAGNMLIRAADGSFLPLDQLITGHRLPRVQQLLVLKMYIDGHAALGPEVAALSAVHELHSAQLIRSFSPAEIVQFELSEPISQPGGGWSLRHQLNGPEGTVVKFDELKTMPTYSAVKKRMLWQLRARVYTQHGHKALAGFAREQSRKIALKMTEAEAVQARLIELEQVPRPTIEFSNQKFSWTGPKGRVWCFDELEREPLFPNVQKWQELRAATEGLDTPFFEAESISEKARVLTEGHTALLRTRELYNGFSKAELMQLMIVRSGQ